VEFYEIQQGGHAIEGDIDNHNFWSNSFNHSKISDIQTSQVDAKLAPVNLRPLNFVF
jgi:hypothetical protein